MFKRLLQLPQVVENSFFLWGPRQTGKTSLLKATYPGALFIDLLISEDRIKYLQQPGLLRKELIAQKKHGLVVIDEIQKVPDLLNEVHWLIENTDYKFCLCGSSARKLKRTGANLLGGRAIRYELSGLSWSELKQEFLLDKILNRGYLPRHYQALQPDKLIRAYIADYLTEEIAEEGLVRNLPKFADFLRSAALTDTAIVNYKNIAEDCNVSSPTVKDYFQILIDTLLGKYLPSYVKRQKRKVLNAPKFYMSDVAIVNNLARKGEIILGSEQAGGAFENWIFHELTTYSNYSEKFYELSYWRLAGTQHEVDFIINDMEIAIEVKTSNKIAGHHLRSLYELTKDNTRLKRVILVCREAKRRIEGNRIEIVPYADFMQELWDGGII